MDNSTDKKSDGAGKKNRAGSKKKSKNAQLTIREDANIAPSIQIPPGSRFKGYRDFVVSDLIIMHSVHIIGERHIRNATEGALLGSLLNQLHKLIHGNKAELLRVLERGEATDNLEL